MRDVIHQQYFRRCNGAECQLPSNVIYRPLSCMGQLVNFPMNLPLVLPLHSACLLGDNYIFPWLRPDQMLPPWGLQLAASSQNLALGETVGVHDSDDERGDVAIDL